MALRSEASFRGVKFFIESADDKFGRMTVKHQFPNREKPFVEDMGKKLDSFQIDGYVVGDDHLDQKDNLKNTSLIPGMGTLIHPFYGTIQVFCDDFQVRQIANEKRFTRIQFSFTEAGEPVVLDVAQKTQNIVSAKTSVSIDSIKNEFKPKWAYTKLAYAATQSALATLKQASESIVNAKKAFKTETQFIDDFGRIVGSLESIALDAEGLAEDVLNLITFGILDTDDNTNGVPDLRETLKNLQNLYSFSPSIQSASTTSDSLVNLVQQGAMVTSAVLLSNIEYTSAEEAYTFRDSVLDFLDTVQAGDIGDDLFASIADLRASIVEDIEARAATLSKLSSYTPSESMPVLVIANELYGGIDKEQDIIDRNLIIHPGFARGGQSIDVLLNG